jgi:replicative DNA helicase
MSSTGAIVAGQALRDPNSLVVAANIGVKPDSFAEPFLSRLWAAMLVQEKRGQPFDIVAMGLLFPEQVVRVAELAEEAPLGGATFYARRLLHERWQLDVATKLNELSQRALTLEPADEPVKAFRQDLNQAVADFERTNGQLGVVLAAEAVDAAIADLEQVIVARQDGKRIGISTGFPMLDAVLGAGWRKGSVNAVCARSGKGKTTFAINSFSAAIAAGDRGLFFTVEMPKAELTTKLIARDAKIWGARLLNGLPTDDEIDRLHHVSQRLAGAAWGLDDSFNGNVDALCQRSRAHARVHGLDVIFIDYAQQLLGPNPRATRREHIEYATARLKQLAIELKIAIVLIAQLNRVADDEDEIPGTNLIADSAAVEKDSDAILMLHHYRDDGGSVLHVAKNRHGRDNITMGLTCDWNTGTFSEKKP